MLHSVNLRTARAPRRPAEVDHAAPEPGWPASEARKEAHPIGAARPEAKVGMTTPPPVRPPPQYAFDLAGRVLRHRRRYQAICLRWVETINVGRWLMARLSRRAVSVP
jgi:hypothetical protein